MSVPLTMVPENCIDYSTFGEAPNRSLHLVGILVKDVQGGVVTTHIYYVLLW